MASGPRLTIDNLSLQEFLLLKKKKKKENLFNQISTNDA
jgi:hypothetical protein